MMELIVAADAALNGTDDCAVTGGMNSAERKPRRRGGSPKSTGGWSMAVTTVGEQLDRARAGHTTRWLVDGIIVEGGATMIHAQYGHGKSLITMDLALAAVEGRPWLGAYPIAQQPVLYVDEDGNNDAEMNGRLLAFGARSSAPLYFHLHQGFKITNARHRTQMIQWCGTNDVRLVIFDSLVRLHDLPEGSADAMKQVNAAIKAFTLAGISVVILHHSNRRGGLRGSSEIGAGYDAIYRMEKVDAGTFRVTNEKARSVGANGVWPGCTIAVSTDVVTGRLVLDGSLPLDTDDDDVPILLTPAAKRERKQAGMREGVLSLLAEMDEVTESAMAEALGNSSRDKDMFKALLAELEAEGEVTFEKRGKGRYYRMAIESETEHEDK